MIGPRSHTRYCYVREWDFGLVHVGLLHGARMDPRGVAVEQVTGTNTLTELERLTKALEDIALLDEADGHELTDQHALKAVAIATSTLGKHPSEIFADRERKKYL